MERTIKSTILNKDLQALNLSQSCLTTKNLAVITLFLSLMFFEEFSHLPIREDPGANLRLQILLVPITSWTKNMLLIWQGIGFPPQKETSISNEVNIPSTWWGGERGRACTVQRWCFRFGLRLLNAYASEWEAGLGWCIPFISVTKNRWNT